MRFRQKNKRQAVANVEMTPMIDVVFQLLIFFMLTSTFVVHTSIPLDLAESPSGTRTQHQDIVISVVPADGGPDSAAGVYINETAVTDWREFTDRLRGLHEQNPDALVLVRPDRRVTTERLVRVLGYVNSVGFTKFGLAAQAVEEKP